MTTFWRFYHPDLRDRDFAKWDKSLEMEIEQITCPVDPGHMRGGREEVIGVPVILLPAKPRDVYWTFLSEKLVTDRVLDLFRSHEFTGFTVKPVQARYKRRRDAEPPRLWELVVTGWGGMAPPESGIRLTENCPGCGYQEYSDVTDQSKLIDERQWDGSDFFFVWPLPNFIFVTDRVANVIREHNLTGVELVPPEQLKFSGSGFTPGRLSYWLPEDRARELGEPLGIF